MSSPLSKPFQFNTLEDTTILPSHESIFGQFKEKKDDNSFDYFKKVIIMFLGTVGCTLSLMILLAVPLSMIIIGVKYKDDCPIEPFIPIYLIVGGSFGILKTIIIILQRIIYNEDIFSSDVKEATSETPMSWMLFDGILNLFLFTWFIAGNIWVYSKYKPNFIPPLHQPLNYCNKILYMYSFWLISVCYMVMVLICFCTCCLGVCASCTAYFVTGNTEHDKEDD